MGDPKRHVLVVGADPSMLRRIAPMLHRAEFAIHTAPSADPVLDLVRGTLFELVVVAFPLHGMPLEELLKAVREGGSSCRTTGFLLLCDPDFLAEAQRFVDRGANRAIGADWNESRLWQAFSDLLEVAPRIAVRVLVHLAVRLQQDTRLLECHAANLSRTGMLLAGPPDLDPGTALDFIFAVTGQAKPIRGAAEMVRVTNPERERFRGFGVRFLSFRDDDQARLESFLEERLREIEAAGPRSPRSRG
jgi:hypothetical protein